MCCDGTLFYSVTLQPGELPRSLTSLGLALRRKNGVTTLRQPCPAHQNQGCCIYKNRPQRCRIFECQQIRRISSGETSESESRKIIQTTRQRIAKIETMIDRITETNPSRGLAQRCAVAVANSPSTKLANELTAAMSELQEILKKEFRVPEATR
ncbi:MAG: hypothetical protein EBQ51_01565 [Verrucomicrobia bacterium]|nr:hypothetical protein [Verrucomicrobiota bacterium]NBS78739.1 hypothetical protein [bacterium]NBV96298.1 hypothetical protein [Verrucomicrobiota bacterium]NBY65761.1 hypothetical protein [Verrucomicrobiota bacterium]